MIYYEYMLNIQKTLKMSSDVDIDILITGFAALLYNPRDTKNKNKWKHYKIIKKNEETLVNVYGKPKNKLRAENFNEKKIFFLDADNDKINGGSPRIIINLTKDVWKIAFVKAIFDEDNYEMINHDYLIYYESNEYQIDTNNDVYSKIKFSI